jgi:protein phosphatase
MIGHVGDSRVYRVRKGRIEQLTFDHSLQWEMIRLGRATAENVELYHPRNVITRCLGPDLAVQVDVEGPFSVEPGDVFMLCSDGLTNHVNDEELGVILSGLPPEKSSRLLIDLANCRGGSDNSTVIVVHIESYPALAVRPPDSSPLPPAAAAVPSGGFPVTLMLLVALISLGLAGWTMFRGRPELSAIFAIAAIAAFLLSRYFRPEPAAAPRLPTAPLVPLPDDPRLDPSMSSALRSSFRTSPPYRTVDCQNPQELLKYLAEAQSELAQAARDSSWRVDFDELTQLGRQATAAIQSEKPDKAIRARARAIELLMKEIYQRRGASTAG